MAGHVAGIDAQREPRGGRGRRGFRRRVLVVVAALALFAAGCGDDDGADTAATTVTTGPQPEATVPAQDRDGTEDDGAEGDAEGDGDTAADPGREAITIDIVSITEGFDPATATVPAGTEVSWVNDGDVAHTTTAQDDTWDSGSLAPGEAFSFTPEEPGSYPYICTIHPSMTGELIVE